MNKSIQFCLKVLSGNITYDDHIVKVIKRGYPLDKTPCITLDDSGGTALLSKDLIDLMLPLPETHPQYDSNDPGKLFAQEVLRSKYSSNVNIHVWCNSETQRENIDNQVKTLFMKAFTDHYMFCTQYDNGTCKTIDTTCPATTLKSKGKPAKNQCPNTKEYQYENIFTKLDLDKYTFELEEPFSMDDLSKNPRALRSIHRLRITYYTNFIVGGNTLTNITKNNI